MSLVKRPPAEPGAAARSRSDYDDFWAQTVPRTPPPPRVRPSDDRRVLAAMCVGLLVVLGIGVGLIAQTPDQDSEVLGQRSSSSSDESGPAGPPASSEAGSEAGSGQALQPQEVAGAATVGADGAVALTVTLAWPDGVPAVIEVGQPALDAIEAVPDDASAVLGRPEASLDGSPLPVEAVGPETWRVLVPETGSAGPVLLTYQLDDALHRDRLSPPGRALAVIPLPTVGASAGIARQVSLPAEGILNVSCPASVGDAVTLCGTRQGGRWLVDVPPEGDVVLAQMDLPAL